MKVRGDEGGYFLPDESERAALKQLVGGPAWAVIRGIVEREVEYLQEMVMTEGLPPLDTERARGKAQAYREFVRLCERAVGKEERR